MKKYLKSLWMLLLFSATFLFLQGFSAYHFYYIEQFQLFLATPLYFFESISHPGGLMEYISCFLVQFFILPYGGAVIEAIILLLLFIVSSMLILRSGKSKIFFIAPASIFLSCLLMCFNFNIFLQGILSFLLCLICLNIFISEGSSIVRNILVFMAVPFIYWLAGPVSLLFAFCFCLYELLHGKSKERFYWLFLPAFACLISWLSVRFSFTGNFRVSFLPDLYYQAKLSPSVILYFPWALLLCWISLTGFLSGVNISVKKSYWILGIQSFLFLSLFALGIIKYGDRESREAKKLDYYARNEQWDKIIAESKGIELNNYLYLNYLNLALAEKGDLSERIFQFSQKGPLSLEVSRQKKNLISSLMSDISFAVGDIASSQRYAFEGYETNSGGGSGRLLKRLIQTNLIYGEYAVAEKYIRILEHTFFYREWAVSRRKFLYNDTACMCDALISAKRKYLPPSGSREFSGNFPRTLNLLTGINKENKIAKDYLLAFCLLSKDLKQFETLLELYLENEIKSGKVSDVYQQATLMYYESQPEKWGEMGISAETIRQYKHYKYTFFKNRQNTKIKEIMKKQFSSTYWFYFQFV
jgi:hypothetical protein